MSKTGTIAQSGGMKFEELLAITDRAQKGDKTALPALRELLTEPARVDQLGGDLAKQVPLTLVHKFAGANLLIKETLPRKLDLLREELTGPNTTPLERLLVDRIVVCWLYLHYLEIVYAARESISLELGNYYERCISSAQKRYLAAIKTLAVVRKLAIPVLQVNIARKQMNVAGSCVAADTTCTD